MILVDANILLYAHIREFPQHIAAHAWFDRQLNGPMRVGLPWPSLLAFLRIATSARAVAQPVSIVDAWRQVDEWLECDPVWIPEPTERHRECLETLLLQSTPHGNLIPDAHLAALSIEHGLTLCSADGDFARFQGVKWLNPLRT